MTDHHFEVASDMPNFSKWVRERIEEYIVSEEGYAKATRGYRCEKCEKWFELPPQNTRLFGLSFRPTTYKVHGKCQGELRRVDLV